LNIDELKSTVEVRDWFHRIDLGDGIVTPRVDDSPNKLSALGMPADLSGKQCSTLVRGMAFFRLRLNAAAQS